MSMDKSVIGVVWVQVFVHLALFFCNQFHLKNKRREHAGF